MSHRPRPGPARSANDHQDSVRHLRRAGKVFEGLFFLLFLSVPLGIAVTFDVLPVFGSRLVGPTVLRSEGAYLLGLVGYVALALAAIVRIVEGFDPRPRMPYGRIVWTLAAVGIVSLCTGLAVVFAQS